MSDISDKKKINSNLASHKKKTISSAIKEILRENKTIKVSCCVLFCFYSFTDH